MNTKINGLDLAAFVTNAPQLTPLVQVPHNDFFKVITNLELKGKFFNLVTCNKLWWLIADDVIGECEQQGLKIENLWKAELFQALYQTGRNLLIPATAPLAGKEFWRETLQEAIDAARDAWVKLEKSNHGYDYHCSKQDLLDENDWQILSTAELLNEAFAGRVIATFKQAEKKLSLVSIEEEDEDEPAIVVPLKPNRRKTF